MKLSPMKTIAYAMPTRNLTALCKDLRDAGYEVKTERETREAWMDTHRVMMALKHPAGVWIVRARPEVVQIQEPAE